MWTVPQRAGKHCERPVLQTHHSLCMPMPQPPATTILRVASFLCLFPFGCSSLPLSHVAAAPFTTAAGTSLAPSSHDASSHAALPLPRRDSTNLTALAGAATASLQPPGLHNSWAGGAAMHEVQLSWRPFWSRPLCWCRSRSQDIRLLSCWQHCDYFAAGVHLSRSAAAGAAAAHQP